MFHAFSIRSRFYLVMAAVSLSLLVLGGWGWTSGVAVHRHANAIFTQSHAAAADIAALRESLSRMRRWESAAMAIGTSNAGQVQALTVQWQQEIQNVHSAAGRIRSSNADNADITALLDRQAPLLQAYVAVLAPTLDQLHTAVIDSLSALAYAAKADATLQALEANTAQLVDALHAAEVRAREQMAAQSNAASLLRLGLVGLTLLLFLPLMWITLQSVCRPLDRAVALARRIATGDLSEAIVVTGRDETAQLLAALAAMQAALGQVVGEVRDAAQSTRLASGEVASGNLDLSQRTEQTASELQTSAALMAALTRTVQQAAQAAGRADALAASAAQVATEGGSVVAQVVHTMDEIQASAQKIASIISVIDGIAFQTNILALNAAVEAARAGEQGRGFAVVASEVRNLATRSAQAAREIKGLIDSSVERVDAGSRLVASAGGTMQGIVSSVQRVTQAMQDIRTATAEQSAGMGELGTRLAGLDQMTQQNAALVEQSAAAAASLQGQAEKLAQVVGIFRLLSARP